MNVKRRASTALIAAALLVTSGCSATRQPSVSNGAGSDHSAGSASQAADEAGIRKTMSAYNAALNGGKTSDVLPLYTDDGIFMPPYSQSAIGKAAIRQAYDAVFQELKFNVKFNVAELVEIR